MEEDKKIRFIDSQYQTLFYIPDGANIALTYSDGETAVRPCKFIDDYHTQIGNSIFHICQFAESMERNGTKYAPEQAQPLPDICYSILPSSGALIVIEKGKSGYCPCDLSAPHREQNEMTAARFNRRLGVTPQQEAAMFHGSMFGRKTRGARTDSYDLAGKPLVPPAAQAKEAER